MNLKYFGSGGYGGDIYVQPGWTLRRDRYGLSAGQMIYKIRPGRYDLLPAYNSPHPYADYATLETREIKGAAAWWLVVCDYAGAEEDESDPEYELGIDTGNEPIETHPKFVSDIAGKPSAPKNGAIFVDDTGHPTTDDKVGVFDRFRLLLPNGSRNKMAGVTAYEAVNNIVWMKSWTSRARPTDGGDVGKIENPEGPNPNYSDGRNWKYMGMGYKKRGKAYSIRKIWKLSGPGGWNETIYGGF